jgi:hypothetical protein
MRVCVVGGGPAGLGMAHFLDRAGFHDVVVLEKRDHVGGKCRTLSLDGRAYDMGAVEVTKEYRIVHELIDRFECPVTNVPGGRVIDRSTGATQPVLSLFDGVPRLELVEQFGKFFLAQRALADYLDKPGFAGVPKSLQGVSFARWLQDVGAPLVERFFWMPLTCYGYGELDRIPAIYALKFATVMPFHFHAHRLGLQDLLPPNLHLLEPFVQRLTYGMQMLMERIAASLPVAPILNATITSVQRSAGGVRVSYRVGADPTEHDESFDRLVVAIPQTLANLSFLDLTGDEQCLFANVSTNHYYTSLTKPRTLDWQLYYELVDAQNGALGPPTLPHVMQFARSWPQALGSVFYTCSAADDPRPLDGAPGSVEDLVKRAVVAAGQQPGATTTTIPWQYFPQVPQSAIDAGFYDDLEGIQGKNGTFYTGALLNFELVEKAMEYSRSLVDRFFAPN